MSGKSIAGLIIVIVGAAAAIDLLAVDQAQAQGIIVSEQRHETLHWPIRPPRPSRPWPTRPIHHWTPFSIKSQRVDVSINDAAAETTLEQVFLNRSRRPAEGTYLFPIAAEAAVHNFTMWMNGREVTAELLDADKARGIYQSIVSKMKDPALLEFTGRGLIRAKVFPIPAGGEAKIKLRYTEPVRSDAGLMGYRFPLRGGAGTHQPIEQFSLRAVIRSTRPLTSVFSPSHECSIDHRGDREAVVGFERRNVRLENDFQLFVKMGDEEFGLALLTHRAPGADGFFMARIAPKQGSVDDAVLPKNICFVLDTSGSMADDNKIAQAKKALNFCVTNLGGQDRFNIVTFATEVRAFRERWVAADEDAKSSARSFINGLNAIGGTDINAALEHALGLNPKNATGATGDSWRTNPFFVVFITDGEPTVGVTDVARIIKNAAAANTNRAARLFSLGVGFQVNTKLLDRLADDNGGARDYVTPTEDLELKLSAFYTKLAHPVLTRLALAFQGVSSHDVYPRRLPDLFKGSELVVMGRYAGDGKASLELTGTRRGEPVKFRYPAGFPATTGEHDFLPRMWAAQKIGYLLDELRLHGDNKELKNEVIRLSKKYGIMTPYTSFLVQEDQRVALRLGRAPVGGRPMSRPAVRAFARNQVEMDEAKEGNRLSVGRKSVDASRRNQGLRRLARGGRGGAFFGEIQDFMSDESGQRVLNFIGAKTFYQDGDRWVDSDYDGKTKPIRLVAFSDDYYGFIANNRGVGRYLAQGNNVVLNWRGSTYEVVSPADPSKP